MPQTREGWLVGMVEAALLVNVYKIIAYWKIPAAHSVSS